MNGIERLRDVARTTKSHDMCVCLLDIADQIEREQSGRLMPDGYESKPCSGCPADGDGECGEVVRLDIVRRCEKLAGVYGQR